MSWLRQTINNSVNQISGQLKDILTETQEEIIDPEIELRTAKQRLEEHERYIEVLKQECIRLNTDNNEAIERYQALEIQLENMNGEYRRQSAQKDATINDLRDQLNQMQTITSEKSAFMDFEEIMPSSDLNDYINLQKEIKRLQDDNRHLYGENQRLLDAQKTQKLAEAMNSGTNSPMTTMATSASQSSNNNNAELLDEINELKNRLKFDNDKHQQEIIAVELMYSQKVDTLVASHRQEMELKLSETNAWKDDGWNTLDDEAEQRQAKIKELTDENERLSGKIAALNEIVANLNDNLNDLNDQIHKEQAQAQQNDNTPVQDTRLVDEVNELRTENAKLTAQLDQYSEDHARLAEIDHIREENLNLNKLLNDKEKEKTKLLEQIDSKTNDYFDVKKRLDTVQKDFDELNENYEVVSDNVRKLEADNARLLAEYEQQLKVAESQESKFDVNEYQMSINALQHERSQIYFYLQQKSDESLNYYNEIQRLNAIVVDLNKDLCEANEKYKNLESELSLETKLVVDLNDETENLKKILTEIEDAKQDRSDFSMNYNSSDTSQADYEDLKVKHENLIEKYEILQARLKELEELKANYKAQLETDDKLQSELRQMNELKTKHAVLQETNDKLQSEVKQFVDLRNKFMSLQGANEKLQMDLRDFVDLKTKYAVLQEINDKLQTEFRQIGDLNAKYTSLQEAYDRLQAESKQAGELKTKQTMLQEKCEQLQLDVKRVTVERDQILMSLKEKEFDSVQKCDSVQKLNKELERLREHLIELSDNHTREAIQAEQREKDLRTLLSQAEENIQSQNTSIINTNKDQQKRNQELTHENEDLREEKQRLIGQLKHIEDSYQNQLKVTKNLELLLERLQKDKDSQHLSEIAKYQDTIKQNAVTIHSLQSDCNNLQEQLEELKEVVSAASRLNEQLEKKDEIISYLQQQMQLREDEVQLLEAKIGEVQKVNSSYIEKDIVKNLLIGYLKVNQSERKQVLKLIGSMLNFTPKDYEQIEQSAQNETTTKWLTSMLSPLSGKGNKQQQQQPADTFNKSFTELLIQYVDDELKPKPRITFDLSSTASSTAPTVQSKAPFTSNPLLNPAGSAPSSNPMSASTLLSSTASYKKTDSPLFLKNPLNAPTTRPLDTFQSTATTSLLPGSTTQPTNRFLTGAGIGGVPSFTTQFTASNQSASGSSAGLSSNKFLEDALK